MTCNILEVINGGSVWLLLASNGRRIVEQVIEPRYMSDIVDGEGLSHPSDLVGREIEISEDGMDIAFV